MNWIFGLLNDKTRETLSLRWFGLTKIPVLFYFGVSVTEITKERMVVRIPLRRRTKNHLGSMYFGALCAGADCAAGAFAMHLINSNPSTSHSYSKTSAPSSSNARKGTLIFVVIKA